MEQCCSVSATGEGRWQRVGNGNHIVLAEAPGAVLTFPVPSRLWCAVAGFRSSAPWGEGAERGRRGLKVERALRRARLCTQIKAGRAPVLRRLPPPARADPPLQKTGRVYAGVSLKITGKSGMLLSSVQPETSEIN